jgi:nitrite reductase/ring-hydroxylating ferredoxin subunit
VVTWHVYKGRRFDLLDLYNTSPQLLQHPNKSIAVPTRPSSTIFIVQPSQQATMSRWFNFGAAKDHDQGPQTTKALPASWYRSSAMYDLERRAIFSRKWIVVSHKARFVQAGDFLRITEAGFTFFLIKDRRGEIRAHHNVCRHRAYPLIEQDSGKLSILSCKYHGKLILVINSYCCILIPLRLVIWIRWQTGQSSKVPRDSIL